MRGWLVAFAVLGACSGEDTPSLPVAAAAPMDAPTADAAAVAAKRSAWTFAVLSDLHLPNPKHAVVEQTVAALIAMKVRFVVITGDSTNGSAFDGPKGGREVDTWWATITQTLKPLRDAGIAVFPIAGNHDAYTPRQRDAYTRAFADLAGWAKPFAIHAGGTSQLAKPPFSYSIDVDGVHLALAHVVATKLAPEVATWFAADLAGAAAARHRIAFGHVPLSSVIWSPSHAFMAQLGGILEAGHVEMYIAGHEHVVWDEDVALPAGAKLRQLLVGCSSGFYDYAPSPNSKQRAACVPIQVAGKREPMRCKMPNGGVFEIARGRKNRHIQHYKNSFTLITVDGDHLGVRPMTVDDAGRPLPFYLDE